MAQETRKDKKTILALEGGKNLKKLKISILSMIILLNFLFTSGCWNYKEINDMAIVAGVAVDYDSESDLFIVTAEIIYPTVSEKEITILSELITDTGKNVFDAIRNTIKRSGIKIFWGHAKILIISEDLAKNKDRLLNVLDWFNRDAEVRHDIYCLIAKNIEPHKILESNVELETIMSFFLADALANEKSISKYHGVPLWEFIDYLSIQGISPTLPFVGITKQENKQISQLMGAGIFKSGILVGSLSGDETKNYLFVINKLKGGVLVVEEKVNNESSKVTLEILNSKTKVKPKFVDDQIIMEINIESSVNISELQGSTNFIEDKYRKKLTADAEKLLKDQINATIEKVQKEYGADIFGFGLIIERENPKLWSKLKDDWSENFKKLEIEISVDINIKGSSLRSKPITVGG